MRIIRNAARCRLCGSVIESRTRHDLQRCHCGVIFVDGGKDILRAGVEAGYPISTLHSLSEVEDDQHEPGEVPEARPL